MAIPTVTSPTKNDNRKIIAASAAGALVEWYDLFIYGSLATVLAGQFYPPSNPAAGLLYTLASFAAGFLLRPVGARLFGPGRSRHKYAYLLPLLLMGGSTFAIGLIPGYTKIGLAAPLLVLLLRLLQGLASGSDIKLNPSRRRGLYTSWIQATASLGLVLGLAVILLVRRGLDADGVKSIGKFNDWGWRIPFLISPVLTSVAVYIRSKMQEWPVLHPLQTGVSEKANRKLVLLALVGSTMGQGVVFYTCQLYVQPFLDTVCQIDFDQARTMLLLAVLIASPFYILFGSWSDRIGHKWIMMTGLLLAVVSYPFLFRELHTIPSTIGRTELSNEKEIVSSVSFIENSKDLVHISTTINHYEGGLVVTQTAKDTLYAGDRKPVTKPVVTINRKVSDTNFWKITAILFLLVFCSTMITGAMAAFLAGLLPEGSSLPFALGNGIIGGMTPFIAMLLTTMYPGHVLAGLVYPIGVAIICLIAGVVGLPTVRSDDGKA